MATKESQRTSGALPFGKQVGLSTIAGATYETAQTLVQQVAYLLSDKLWSYSPETFDLDISARQWAQEQEKSVHDYFRLCRRCAGIRSGRTSPPCIIMVTWR